MFKNLSFLHLKSYIFFYIFVSRKIIFTDYFTNKNLLGAASCPNLTTNIVKPTQPKFSSQILTLGELSVFYELHKYNFVFLFEHSRHKLKWDLNFVFFFLFFV